MDMVFLCQMISSKGFIRSRDVIFAEERFHDFSDE